MANGLLVKMLLHTKVTRYLEWKCCDASYVLQLQKAGMFSSAKNVIHKVPATDTEVLRTPLLGLFEKQRAGKLYKYLDKVDENDPKTWGAFDLKKATMAEVFKSFNLSDNCIDFLGHSLALHVNDDYL